jgi:hypothetical protein
MVSPLRRLFGAVLALVLLVRCADERPVRPVPPNPSRIEKKRLTGGEFLFLRTIVGAGAGAIGRRLPAGGVLVDAAPVRLQFTDSTLDVVREVPRRIEDASDREAVRVASFRARSVDVTRKRTLDDRLVAEEEETELRRPAAERSHAVIDFTDLPFGPLATEVRQSTLLDPPRWLDENTLTCLVQRTLADGSELRERLSFRRLPAEDFVSRRYGPELMRRFGFFKRRHLVADGDDETTFAQSDTWAARWPKSRPLKLATSADLPAHWRSAIGSVVKTWNKRLVKDGTFPGIELEEMPLGFADPRVNGIYRVEESLPTEHGLLAYASVVIREDRGEIIKADIYFYGGALRRFRHYLRSRSAPDTDGRGDGSDRASPFSAPHLPSSWLPPPLSLPRLLVAMGAMTSPDKDRDKEREERMLPMAWRSANDDVLKTDHRRCGMLGGDSDLDRWAETLPPTATAEEAEAQLVRMLFAHELGHALGLRHNFLASADKARFEGDGKSTSVMDYHATPPSFVIGPYDRAALRTLYREDEPPDATPYWYCSELDPQDRRGNPDPLCAPYDEGTSLNEAVLFHMNRYRRDYRWLNERRGRVRFPEGSDGESRYVQAVHERLMPLRRIVDAGVAAAAANRRADIGRMWLLFGPRIEADDKTWAPDRQLLTLPGGRTIEIDRERLRAARTDAVSAGEQAAKMLARLVDTSEGSRRPDLDELDPSTGRVERLGILRDRAIALILLSVPTPSPLADGEITSPLAVEDAATLEAFTRVLSGTEPPAADSKFGFRTRALVPAPTTLRYFAIELLRRLRDESNLLAPVVRSLLPVGPSEADPHALSRWRTLALEERAKEDPERLAATLFNLSPRHPLEAVMAATVTENLLRRSLLPKLPQADDEDYRRLVALALLEEKWAEEAAKAMSVGRSIDDTFRDRWQKDRLEIPWTFAPTANGMSYYRSPCYPTQSGKVPISCFWLRDNIARLRLHLAAYQLFEARERRAGRAPFDVPEDIRSATAWLAEETALLESAAR